jgi:hypothetical protein
VTSEVSVCLSVFFQFVCTTNGIEMKYYENSRMANKTLQKLGEMHMQHNLNFVNMWRNVMCYILLRLHKR